MSSKLISKLPRYSCLIHSTVTVHILYVLSYLTRYYEDFKIASGKSNLTQIFVEASSTFVCGLPLINT